MARPDPTDITMRVNLALQATEEVTDSLTQLVRQVDDTVARDQFPSEVYSMIGHLAEGLGNVAMALNLIEEQRSQG